MPSEKVDDSAGRSAVPMAGGHHPCRACSPEFAAIMPVSAACRIVWRLVAEVIMLSGDRVRLRRDRRGLTRQIRHVSIYVCHVALCITMREIGQAFGLDRTTVRHACHVVEDRRDDAAFDAFLCAIERMVGSIFLSAEGPVHD